jgi:Vacuolar protein sorting 55
MQLGLLNKYNNMAAGIKSMSLPLFLLFLLNLMSKLAVILLSFVLAVGFLMIILSCALWSNWLPLFVGQ